MVTKKSETDEVTVKEVKLYLLQAIMDKENNVSPSQDALNYAAALQYLANAEKADRE